jgi:hypothetical protein
MNSWVRFNLVLVILCKKIRAETSLCDNSVMDFSGKNTTALRISKGSWRSSVRAAGLAATATPLLEIKDF